MNKLIISLEEEFIKLAQTIYINKNEKNKYKIFRNNK